MAFGSPVSCLEGVDEELGQAHGVVVGDFADDDGLLGSHVLERVVGHDGALEGIEEADAEVEVVVLGDQGVGAGKADGRDLRVLEDGTGGHGEAGTPGAEHHVDLVAVDQALAGVGGFDLVGLVVGDDQLDLVFLAADGDRRVQALGQPDAVQLLGPAGGVGAGERLEYSELDYICVLLGGSGASAADKGQGDEGRERRSRIAS